MPWIAKRRVKVQREGKIVILPPGTVVPEAVGFTNPTLWCVWADKEPNMVTEIESTVSTEGNSGGGAEGESKPNYLDMTVKQLQPLAQKRLNELKDDSTNVKKSRKDELIAIIESGD